MHDRQGHVFQSRFRSILVQTGDYAYELIRYIHLNPLRAGIVPDLPTLSKYHCSSHAHFMGNRRIDWICEEILIGMSGRTDSKCWHQNYLAFLARESSYSAEEFDVGSHILDRKGIRDTRDEEVKWSPSQARILGSVEFARKIYHERTGKRGFHVRSREVEHQRMHTLTKAVSAITGVPLRSLRSSGRSAGLSRARRVLIRLLSDETGISKSDMARYLCVSITAVTKSLQRELDAQDLIAIRTIKEPN